MNEIEQILTEWNEKLDLDEHIYITFKNDIDYSNIRWNPFVKAFTINIKQPYSKTSMIHELGHIYIAKLYNDMGLIKNNLFKNSLPESYNEELEIYRKTLLDPFVDYHLSKFEGYSKLLLYQYTNRYIKTERGKDGSLYKLVKSDKVKAGLPLEEYLVKYMLWYLEYYHILKPLNDNKNNLFIKSHLNNIRKAIIKNSPKEKKFTWRKIQDLDRELNTFRKIKDIKDSSKITNFTNRVINILGFWNPAQVEQYITNRYICA